jgi:molybdate transport system substrate-binding protein
LSKSSNEPSEEIVAAVKEISLWSALVVRGALERVLLPRFTGETGVAVLASFDPTTVLMERLIVEDAPDVIISTTGSLTSPAPRGIAPESVTALVRTGIGVGVAAASPLPRIATTEELTEALLRARSVAYSRAGQSGIRFVELLERLGIAGEVIPRATVLEKGFTGEAVVDGRADIAIQQVSELRFVPGFHVVGPLPEDCQTYTDFSCGLAADLDPSSGEVAMSLVAFLTNPAADLVYRDEGLTVPSSRQPNPRAT